MSIDGKIGTNPEIGIDAKISTSVEINTDPKINTNTKTNIEMKISINEPIFDFPHTKRNFSKQYTNSNQRAGHEDGKVESIRRCSNLPFEFGYSQQIASGEVKHQFGPFYSRCNRITIKRV